MLLRAQGAQLGGLGVDTMLASYLIDPEVHSHRLVDVARFDLDQPLTDLEQPLLERRLQSGVLSKEPIDAIAARVGQLARTIVDAHAALQPKLERSGGLPLLRDVELPLARTLAQIEMTG